MKILKNFWFSFVLMLAFNCAVKQYPRPVSEAEKIKSNFAYSFDTVCAILHRYFIADGARKLDRQKVQLENYIFYAKQEFRENVRNFYRDPEGIPKIKKEVLAERDGYTKYLLVWPSQYKPLNPEFESLYKGYVEDFTAYAVYYESKDKLKSALVINHGWTGGDVRKLSEREKPEKYLSLGFDVAIVQQPYHGLRMPNESKFSGEFFVSGEASRLNEAMAQAVMDNRSLIRWLRESHEVVGIKGGSLGGIVSLAVMTAEPELDFGIAWVPPASFGDFTEKSVLIPYVIEGLRRSGITKELAKEVFYPVSPANYQPLIPKQDILIIAGMGDNFVPPSQPLKLWENWGHPRIHWYPGGHILRYDIKRTMEIEENFLKEKLKEKGISEGWRNLLSKILD